MPRSTLPEEKRKTAGIVIRVTNDLYDEYRAACIVHDTSMSRHLTNSAKALITEAKKNKAAFSKALQQAKQEREEREARK